METKLKPPSDNLAGYMKVVRDPVQGYIQLDQTAVKLIDTPCFQRLRRVRQLGFSYLAYPGANHTRFEHSVGVYHLACQLTHLIDEAGVRREVEIAALLHDIGHGPFSHTTEEIIKNRTQRTHTDIDDILGEHGVAEVLEADGISPKQVMKHIKGETYESQILASEIDIDRMDYLVRDSHYTGAAYGLIDHHRLLHEMRFHGTKIGVERGGLQAAEALLISRFLMHPTVYYHHVSRIAETMCQKAIEYMLEEEEVGVEELRLMDDAALVARLASSLNYPREMAARLKNRKLFKRAVYTGFENLPRDILKYRRHARRLEQEIAETAEIDPGYVIVDIPPPPEISESRAQIITSEKTIPLDKASPIVAALEKSQHKNWRFGVYTPPEHREHVARIARDIFQIKKETKQYRLDNIL